MRHGSRADSARLFHGEVHSPVLQLQRMLGNQRVAQLIQAKRLTPQGKIIGLQPKLTVSGAADQFEQEAGHVASQVLSMPDAAAANSMQRAMLPEEHKEQALQTRALTTLITPGAQRQIRKDDEEEKPIQAKSAGSPSYSFEAGADIESQVSLSKGRGSPLPDSVRAYMEPRFGVDFSQVHVHTGNEALQMNQAVGAQAFTHGLDVYFGAGRNPSNLELTAHELTHVVQQTGVAPLQTKRLAETVSANANPSMQRTCSACEAEKKKESASDPTISMASSVNTAEPLIQRNKIDHGMLTWADFQGEVPKKAKYDAATFSSFEDPDLNAPIPNNAAVDTGDPCKAKGKNLTRFTVDITIDSAQIEIKSFMDQDESWHKPWTTEEPDRRAKCEKKLSPKCEKAFKKRFSKIKKIVAKEKAVCQKEFDKMKKNAKTQCKPAEADCKAAFKNGDPSFNINIDGTDITANTKKECTKVLLPDCVTASMQGQEFTQTLEGEPATATTKAECKTRFAPEIEKLLKDQATWEATMSGASATVNKLEDCRTTFVDACAADLMQAGSDDLLKHEQTHFDLTEAMAQKAQNDLRSLVDAFPTEVDACGQKAAEAKAKKVLASELKKMKKKYAANKKLVKKKQAQYDKETKHGTVEKKQTAWEEKISEGF